MSRGTFPITGRGTSDPLFFYFFFKKFLITGFLSLKDPDFKGGTTHRNLFVSWRDTSSKEWTLYPYHEIVVNRLQICSLVVDVFHS